MPGPATTVNAYLAALPDDRREALDALRRTINDNLNPGFEEGMQYRMPAWFIPHSVYAAGYHCDRSQPVPFASIASQKNHIGIYLFCVYMSPDLSAWFKASWEREHAEGRAGRLDMGKGCIRVKRLSDIPLRVVGEAIRRVTVKDFLAVYEASIPPSKRPKAPPAIASPRDAHIGKARANAPAPRASAQGKAAKASTKKTVKAVAKKTVTKASTKKTVKASAKKPGEKAGIAKKKGRGG